MNNTATLPASPISSQYGVQNSKPTAAPGKTCYQKGEHFWSYGRKLLLVSQSLLNAAARTPSIILNAGPEFADKAKATVTKTKLLSIVSATFTLNDLKGCTQKIFKSFSLNDKEGVALSTLSFSIMSADALDSITTFVNSLLTVIGKAPIALFSSMGLPLALFMNGAGTVSRTIQIIKASIFIRKTECDFKSSLENKKKISFKENLEKNLGIAEEQKLISTLSAGRPNEATREKILKLKEKNQGAILRLLPVDVVKSLEKLFVLLDTDKYKPFTKENLKETAQILKAIRSSLRKKTRVNVVEIVANLFITSALALFSIGSTTAMPFLLLAAAFKIKIACLAYQNHKS